MLIVTSFHAASTETYLEAEKSRYHVRWSEGAGLVPKDFARRHDPAFYGEHWGLTTIDWDPDQIDPLVWIITLQRGLDIRIVSAGVGVLTLLTGLLVVPAVRMLRKSGAVLRKLVAKGHALSVERKRRLAIRSGMPVLPIAVAEEQPGEQSTDQRPRAYPPRPGTRGRYSRRASWHTKKDKAAARTDVTPTRSTWA
jgi:hypothetical protein